jgi:hypothetical protein
MKVICNVNPLELTFIPGYNPVRELSGVAYLQPVWVLRSLKVT